MTWRTSLWLAFRGGHSDRLRIVLTADATALATVFLLLAAAVVAPRTDRSWYSVLGLWDDPGMVPGVVFALVLLCLPPLALAVQCGRVGAPARDRRFADLARMGASAGDRRRLAALEAGVASVAGLVLGAVAYAVLALVVDLLGAPVSGNGPGEVVTRTWFRDANLLPTDRFPDLRVVACAVVVVPVVVVVASLLLRGRPRGASAHPRSPWLAPLVAALSAYAVIVLAGRFYAVGVPGSNPTVAMAALMTAVVAAVVLVLAVGFLAGAAGATAGAWAARRARHPALLLAGRRLAVTGGRRGVTSVTLLVGCAIGGAAVDIRQSMLTGLDPGQDPGDFFGQTFGLLLVGLGVATAVSALGLVVAEVEAVVERRRSLATAVAAGVPRGVLARSVVLEVTVSVLPAVVVTTLVGALAAHRMYVPLEQPPTAFPVLHLALFLVGVTGATLLAASLATLALPASTDVSEARVPA